jgi:methionine sulfoxide reductase heme-binding subunit
MSTHFWWYLSRSTGIIAWVLGFASVIWGMLLSTRAMGRKVKGPWLLDLHRWLAALTCTFVVVHVAVLSFDSYAPFSVSEMLVPMASEWKPVPVLWGIIALYALVVVQISSLIKNRLPKKLWHSLHLLSIVFYVTSTVHMLMAGSDTSNPLLFWGAIGSVVVVVWLLGWRLGDMRRAKLIAETEAKRAKARANSPKGNAEPAGDRKAQLAAIRAARAKETAEKPAQESKPSEGQ